MRTTKLSKMATYFMNKACCSICHDYHQGEEGHHCPDWDFLFIRPLDKEMEACFCCKHEKGYWLLQNRYGKNNGKWLCRSGCGKILERLPDNL